MEAHLCQAVVFCGCKSNEVLPSETSSLVLSCVVSKNILGDERETSGDVPDHELLHGNAVFQARRAQTLSFNRFLPEHEATQHYHYEKVSI